MRVFNPERVLTRKDPDYLIGYRRPPEEKQYLPGQTGNPKGRPKRAEGQTCEGEVFLRVSKQKMDWQTDNGSKQISRMEAILRKLLSMSLEANIPAGSLLHKLRKMMPLPVRRLAPVMIWISEADAKV